MHAIGLLIWSLIFSLSMMMAVFCAGQQHNALGRFVIGDDHHVAVSVGFASAFDALPGGSEERTLALT